MENFDAPLDDSSDSKPRSRATNARCSFVSFIVWALLTLVFLIASFAPKATIYEEKIGAQAASPMKTLTSRVQFGRFKPTSSIAAFSISVAFNEAVVDRKLGVSFTGRASSLDSRSYEIDSYPVSVDKTFEVAPGESQFLMPPFLAFSRVSFESMVIAVDAVSSFPCLLGMKVIATSIGSDLLITGVVLISLAAVSVGIVVICAVPRSRPKFFDHWFIVFVAGALFFVDGPWLLLQFYALPAFSQVFDVMPQLFHILFLCFVAALFKTRTTGFYQKLFGHWALYAGIAIMQIIVLTLQFWGTGGRSLAMYALYRNYSYGSFITLIVLFIVYHAGVIAGLVIGFVQLRIRGLMSLILMLFICCVMEAIQIITFLIRVFCSSQNIGLAVAADLFYVIEANLATIVLLLVVPRLENEDIDDLT